MGNMFIKLTDGFGHAVDGDKQAAVAHYSAMAVEAAALAAHNVPGYKPQHRENAGECALTLDTLPVLVRYEMTCDYMGNDCAEVVAVSINGHTIDAQDFADHLRAEWGSQCMDSRIKAGWL